MTNNLPEPIFISTDAAAVQAASKAYYEGLTGKTLEPAQVEQLVLNAGDYRELLLRNEAQDAAKQNLLAFARFPIIDYLGEFLGVFRLAAAAARTTIELTLVEGHGDVVIPSGTRVSTSDGRVIFALIQDYSVLTAVDTVLVTAEAQTPGKSANDYAIGTVTTILDPQAYLETASNTTITEGGSDEETDDQLRERIRLAPNRFSNAGPVLAYKFWASSASPLIIDVAVPANPVVPGTVRVYPLVAGLATTPTEILDAVDAVLNKDKIRPLSDTVEVISPTAVNTTITVELILYDWAVQADVLPVVQSNLEAFRDGRRKLLGQDIIVDQIKAVSVIDGVYKANVISPSADLVISEIQFANITAVTASVVGTNPG